MLFNSFNYAMFLPVVAAAYYLLPHRLRWILLFVSSCLFYMAFVPHYILILFVIIIIDYLAALRIENSTPAAKKRWLTLSILANLTILGTFKYYNFIVENVATLAGLGGVNLSVLKLSWLVPLGLSFHTFQSIAYVIEVYYANVKAERHLGHYANYVLFFPQLVAGPIERPQNLLPQLHRPARIDPSRLASGLRLILLGIFQKVVVADNVAPLVDKVFAAPASASPLALLCATYLFAIQIYCDFGGYSLVAIGSARLLGIDLMKNFDRPYFSESIFEFWSRWHISLSSWFRDYLYLPLVMRYQRGSRWFQQFCLLLVFAVSGLWHGANWTFVAWGVLHGGYLIIESQLNALPFSMRFPGAALLKRGMTFHLVCFGWIFFRAESLPDAFTTIARIAGGVASVTAALSGGLEIPTKLIAASLVGVIAFVLLEGARASLTSIRLARERVALLRWTAYVVVTAAILFLGDHGMRQFIYFQF